MAKVKDRLPDVRSKDPQTARGTSIGAIAVGNGFKPGAANAPKGSKLAPQSSVGRNYQSTDRNSGNTYKAKPGAASKRRK